MQISNFWYVFIVCQDVLLHRTSAQRAEYTGSITRARHTVRRPYLALTLCTVYPRFYVVNNILISSHRLPTKHHAH